MATTRDNVIDAAAMIVVEEIEKLAPSQNATVKASIALCAAAQLHAMSAPDGIPEDLKALAFIEYLRATATRLESVVGPENAELRRKIVKGRRN